MEAVGRLAAHGATRPGAGGVAAFRPRAGYLLGSDSLTYDGGLVADSQTYDGGAGAKDSMEHCLTLLRTFSTIVADEAAGWDFPEASDVAGRVEELSRAVEYLQVVVAG